MHIKYLIVAVAIISLNLQTQLTSDLSKRVFEVLNSTADEAKKWDDKATAARTKPRLPICSGIQTPRTQSLT